MARKEQVNTKGLIIFLVVTVMLISMGFYTFQIIYSPNIRVELDSKVLIISSDDTFKDVQNILYDGHYVNDLISFSFLSKLMKYNENVKPGRYMLEKNMSNVQAIRMLRAGVQKPVKITFNNVRLLKNLGEKITKYLEVSEEEFNAELANYLSTNEDGFNSETLISMFIPNTYELYYSISAKELINRMNSEYHKFWNEAREKKANELGLTKTEVSTLASIVQAERSKNEESKRIAGLYLNRLHKDIALQADPTLVFASRDFGLKRVLNVHKEIQSPYNTYINKGLPPGPINMPSIHSIDAVLDFESHNFLYMCAREDFSGYHNFAATYEQHMVNARKYQRQLSIEQRKARQNKN